MRGSQVAHAGNKHHQRAAAGDVVADTTFGASQVDGGFVCAGVFRVEVMRASLLEALVGLVQASR